MNTVTIHGLLNSRQISTTITSKNTMLEMANLASSLNAGMTNQVVDRLWLPC